MIALPHTADFLVAFCFQLSNRQSSSMYTRHKSVSTIDKRF